MQPNPSDCSLFHDNRVETPLLQKSSGLENQSHDAWEKPKDDNQTPCSIIGEKVNFGKNLDQAQEFFFFMGPTQVFVVDSRGRRDCIIYANLNTA